MKHQRAATRRRPRRTVTIVAAVVTAAAIATGVTLLNKSSDPAGPLPVHLPTTPQAYLGVYAPPVPGCTPE